MNDVKDFSGRENCGGLYPDLLGLLAETTARPLPPSVQMPLIAIVVPPSPFTVPRGWGYYLERPFEGVTYIATVLHNAGYRVKIVDARFKPGPVAYAAAGITGADVVCIATFEDGLPFIKSVCAAARAQAPARPVILGGSLVTSVPELVMRLTGADYGVLGEGELTTLELMAAFSAGTLPAAAAAIPGLCLRQADGTQRLTTPRLQLTDLDLLPVPDFRLWDRPGDFLRQVIVSTSRGCHKDCAFCYRTTPKLGLKSVEKLAHELAILKERHKAEFLQFTDLTFTFSKARTLALCEMLKGIHLKWWCMTRVQNVDGEILRAMAAAGCDQILYGVETMSQAALDGARKGFSEDETVRALKLTQEAGITVGAAYVVGLPGETPEALGLAAEFAGTYGTPARVKYLSAIPGTRVYREALASGAIPDEAAHLEGMLAREKGLKEDDFLNLSGLPEKVYRDSYAAIEAKYVPGPYGTAALVRDKRAYAYPDRPIPQAEVDAVLAEDARLCSGSLL